MRDRAVKRTWDNRVSQGRIVHWLACNHYVQVEYVQVARMTEAEVIAALTRSTVPCPFCPDPTPEQARESKTPQQLYREAGEP